MAGSSRLAVQVEGLAELRAKLDPKSLYWQPLKDTLDELGRNAALAARTSAGGFARTGLMAASNTHEVNAVPVPLWVVVRNEATSKSGRRYPWILEFDGRFHHKNWLLNAIKQVQATAPAAVQRAVAKIKSNWRS